MSLGLIGQRIGSNWRSGLTVALISIPLSISLAVASGASPATGLITAVWAGLIAAIFGGSHYNIVGPAGALSGVLAAFALTHGAAALPTLAIISGILILIAYFFKLERYLFLIPSSVMSGFSLGVAVTIGLGQLPSALGLKGLHVHESFVMNIWEALIHIQATHIPTVVLFLLGLLVLWILSKVMPKIPGAIVLAPLGIILGWFLKSGTLPLGIQTLQDKFSDLSISFFSIPQFPFSMQIVIAAVGVAFIAILETLISAKIADGMTGTRYNVRREVSGLGIANIVSGLFGGLPATGVFVRTGLNVKSGATHKTSAGINAIVVALISTFVFTYFTLIPMAVIASILVFAAIRMVEVKELKYLWRFERKDALFAFATAVTMIAIDSVVGLIVGAMYALLTLVEHYSAGHFDVYFNDKKGGLLRKVSKDKDLEKINCDVIMYSITGPMNYLNGEMHLKRFEELLPHADTFILRLRGVPYIDHSGLNELHQMLDVAKKAGKQVVLASVPDLIHDHICTDTLIKSLEDDHMVFNRSSDALLHFGIPVRG